MAVRVVLGGVKVEARYVLVDEQDIAIGEVPRSWAIPKPFAVEFSLSELLNGEWDAIRAAAAQQYAEPEAPPPVPPALKGEALQAVLRQEAER